MKTTYLINQVQPDGSTCLSAVSADEWRSAIRENEGLPPERQRYFIRDYIADENDMDCMVIEVSASEYIQWDKDRSAARRNREAGKNFHVSSLDAPLAGMDCTMARLEQLPDQTQLEAISGNMRWSYQHRMKSRKFITCKAPFGYHLKDGVLEVYEPEAEIVRMIFDQYLAGQSKDEIAAHVTTLGIPTRDGKEYWQHSSISYILRNERYVGDALLQKRYTTDTLPYRKKMNHGEREQYYMPQSHPPIIDRETFNAVRELLDRRSITMPRHERDPLALKIICGACGTPFRRTACGQKTYWVCRKHYKSKHNCSMEQIAEDEIHAAFLRVYHKLRLHGGPILRQMISDLQSVRERRMLWSMDIIELNKRISDINDQDRMLADMNKCGLVDPDIFISRSNDLAHQLRTAKLEKDRILGADHDDTIPRTRELMETLETLPEFLPAFDGEIFTDLVDGITADSGNILRFRLKNGLELTERVERSVR